MTMTASKALRIFSWCSFVSLCLCGYFSEKEFPNFCQRGLNLCKKKFILITWNKGENEIFNL